ncbi:MAG: agmatine deiminase family protein [Candidatus Acidiferrum sp.]
MIRSRKRTTPLRFPLLLLLFLSLAARSQSQTASAPVQHSANDVVMLSLQALTPHAELQRQVREKLAGDSAAELDVEKHLLEIQMHIVRETAKFGPVLLLVPDETTRGAILERCEEFQICALFQSDRLRMKVVAHDGVWVRDFGPQIEAAGNSANVVHWRYFDIRTEEAKQEKLQELETARLRLLQARQQQDQPDAFAQESSPDERKALDAAIDAKLYVLREFTQLLNDTSPQRTNDENSAFDIADAVLANPDFSYKSSQVAIDGGNLFKLDDGRCLTTRTLLSRNKDQNINLDQELEKIGGCKQVTFLEPLPGPVIEHIDMFALPVGGNRILLASYDLANPFAAEYWSKLSAPERDLVLNAALAMQTDADSLRRLGYDVVSVPSPFPRIPANGHTYYPSVLNALVRQAADGYREVLIPSYKDYESDIQSAALKLIQDAFGPNSEVVTIEATDAAKAQGSIHCLTLSAPLQLSIFGDSAGSARRIAALARKEQLDQGVAAEIASEIPSTGLEGTWAILESGERSGPGSPDPFPQEIFFSPAEFQKGVFGQLEYKGKYSIDKREPASWSLRFFFPDQDVEPAVAQWLSKDEVKLSLKDANTAMLLRRMNSDRTSPFKPAPPDDATAPSGKKRPTHGKSAASAGHPPVSLEPIQP